ncbi:MAG: protein-glutamate O-methyltransferase CheR [Candidatus Methanomethylicaceae archaeon]
MIIIIKKEGFIMISDYEINIIVKVLEKKGISLPSFKIDFIKRRIAIRMMLTGCKNIIEYCKFLKENPEEAKNLLDSTFINVSEFFRDPPLWRKLRDIIYNIKPLKIWSVGCACGEEPYSLAILLTEANISNVKIIATDIDEKALNFAIYGRYHQKSLINVPNYILNKYFQKEKDNTFIISDNLKKMIKFIKHDVMKDPLFVNCDIVLCRNVLIYFPKESQNIIIEKLWYSLKKGGIFVIGMGEVLDNKWTSYFEPYDIKLRIYRKK